MKSKQIFVVFLVAVILISSVSFASAFNFGDWFKHIFSGSSSAPATGKDIYAPRYATIFNFVDEQNNPLQVYPGSNEINYTVTQCLNGNCQDIGKAIIRFNPYQTSGVAAQYAFKFRIQGYKNSSLTINLNSQSDGQVYNVVMKKIAPSNPNAVYNVTFNFTDEQGNTLQVYPAMINYIETQCLNGNCQDIGKAIIYHSPYSTSDVEAQYTFKFITPPGYENTSITFWLNQQNANQVYNVVIRKSSPSNPNAVYNVTFNFTDEQGNTLQVYPCMIEYTTTKCLNGNCQDLDTTICVVGGNPYKTFVQGEAQYTFKFITPPGYENTSITFWLNQQNANQVYNVVIRKSVNSSISAASNDEIISPRSGADNTAREIQNNLNCTYTYSSWSSCAADGTQTRNILSSSPVGCLGIPVTAHSCIYSTSSSNNNSALSQPNTVNIALISILCRAGNLFNNAGYNQCINSYLGNGN